MAQKTEKGKQENGNVDAGSKAPKPRVAVPDKGKTWKRAFEASQKRNIRLATHKDLDDAMKNGGAPSQEWAKPFVIYNPLEIHKARVFEESSEEGTTGKTVKVTVGGKTYTIDMSDKHKSPGLGIEPKHSFGRDFRRQSFDDGVQTWSEVLEKEGKVPMATEDGPSEKKSGEGESTEDNNSECQIKRTGPTSISVTARSGTIEIPFKVLRNDSSTESGSPSSEEGNPAGDSGKGKKSD
jgi:hypothetical protein